MRESETYFSAASTRLEEQSDLNSGSHFSRNSSSSFTMLRMLLPLISAKHSSIARLYHQPTQRYPPQAGILKPRTDIENPNNDNLLISFEARRSKCSTTITKLYYAEKNLKPYFSAKWVRKSQEAKLLLG